MLNSNYTDLSPDALCYQNYSDCEILNQAGNRFVEVAQEIKDDFEAWWIDWSNPTELGDCLLPIDWSDSFLSNYLQQSMDVSFLDKYLIDSPRLIHDYPETRVITIQENIEDESLITAENIAEVLMIADSESIQEWSNLVVKVLAKFPEIKFSYLLQMIDLSSAQIYLGLLFCEPLILKQDSQNFYGDFSIQKKSNT